MGQATAKQLAPSVEAGHWQDLSAGDGAAGPRLYVWAALVAAAPQLVRAGACHTLPLLPPG
jgi:hypothetical protein